MPKFSRKSNARGDEPKSAADKRALRDLTSEVNDDFQKIVLPTLGVILLIIVVIVFLGTRA